jgi:hypothetical protein
MRWLQSFLLMLCKHRPYCASDASEQPVVAVSAALGIQIRMARGMPLRRRGSLVRLLFTYVRLILVVIVVVVIIIINNGIIQ